MPKETEVLALFFQSASSPEKSPQLKYLENLATGKLVHMRDGNITLYKRERSKQWQMRFRLYDKKWHRVSTGYEDPTAPRVQLNKYLLIKPSEALPSCPKRPHNA